MVPSTQDRISGGDEQNACLLLNSIKLAARRFAYVAEWRKNLAPSAPRLALGFAAFVAKWRKNLAPRALNFEL